MYSFDHIFDKVHLHYGDMVDSSNLVSIVAKVKPDEVLTGFYMNYEWIMITKFRC